MTRVFIREEFPEAVACRRACGTQLGGEGKEGIPGQWNRSPVQRCKGAEGGKHAESGSQACVAGWNGWNPGTQVAGLGSRGHRLNTSSGLGF